MSFSHRAFSIAMMLPAFSMASALQADTPGQALARLPWIDLRVPKSDDQAGSEGPAITIQYRVVDTNEGYALAFRNEGPVALHFGFWIKDWQSKDKAQTSGRIHLPPGEESGPIPVSIRTPGRPPASHCQVQLIHIIQGEGGQGVAWRE